MRDRLAILLHVQNHAPAALHGVGAVGGEFAGMGDFRFDPKDLPLEVVPYTPQQVSEEEALR